MNARQLAILSMVLFGGFAAAGLGSEPDPPRDSTAKAPFNTRQRQAWTSENLR